MKTTIAAQPGYFSAEAVSNGEGVFDKVHYEPIIAIIIESIEDPNCCDPVQILHYINVSGEVADVIMAPDGRIFALQCDTFISETAWLDCINESRVKPVA